MARHAKLSIHSRRLTPVEVAQLWFRRGGEFGDRIHEDYPDFPNPGPDGLYLLSSVEGWFDRFHGIKRGNDPTLEAEQEAAMHAALGIKRTTKL